MTVQTQTAAATEPSLVDLLDRLLGKGVVVTGDVIVSLAGVDLVRIQLSAVIGSVRKEMENL
ncbi:gas vesicle protein GvpA/GvpJ/GvpM family [Kribbella sp. VKM Ac-2571]|uniref:gas vesicle protein n=1 Tax=Kribbella sp. VKM Ac-2571 TaxID=2512222 RepID=UPI00105CF8C5|nr:gas vesicle protein [Kribbella sp. VKM Ac-2571]TDO66538.1 gas vesicle protein GvpA/GvpJ/GvpM family [Kribbella sp. VKM Ac-2571]